MPFALEMLDTALEVLLESVKTPSIEQNIVGTFEVSVVHVGGGAIDSQSLGFLP